MKTYLINDFTVHERNYPRYIKANTPKQAITTYVNHPDYIRTLLTATPNKPKKVRLTKINYWVDYNIDPDFIVEEVAPDTHRRIPYKKRNCYCIY